MDQTEEEQLIRLAVAGDRAALATLLQECEPVLLRYVRKHLSPPVRLTAAPEDVVQETCYEIARQISGFRPDGDAHSFRRWAVRIAHLLSQAAVQKHLNRVKLGTARGFDSDSSVIGAIEELAVHRRTPSKSAADHEFIAAVERSLDKLPPQYREVVTLRHIDGLTVEETANRLGRDRASVSVLTSRALVALRAQLISESRYT